ncbi:hypothetical protein B0H14DRAFT_1629169 [Mycena olivaceomarginata]|nr:hypothetical protein B0H14DRAFT_1629169 [Mycena olivaceomarginata]
MGMEISGCGRKRMKKGIREFAIGNEPLSVAQISEDGNDAFQITEEDWNDAFQALEARFFRTTVAASPVAHLPSQARLRFITWLLVAGPLRKQAVVRVADIPSMAMLIRNWAEATGLPLTGGTCDVCGVSGVLPVWIETMLEVYSPDDLRLLSWDEECNCLHSQPTATVNTYLEQRGVPETPLGRNSPVLRLLYELFVPSWPLFHWVVYRTRANNQAEYLTTFMDILRGPDQDLFTWDDADNSKFL